LPCEGTNHVQGNRYSSSPTGTLVSPSIGTSNGGVVSLSFQYKVTDWSLGTVGTPANFGTVEVQYGPSATGPWTTVYTINSLNHVVSASCATVSVPGFSVANGPTFLRYNWTWAAGDYWAVIDNIVVSQGPPPSCSQPSFLTASSITSSGASLGWTENGTATAWEVEYGLLGFTPGTGTTVAATSNPFAITGLGSNLSYGYYVRANCGVNVFSAWSGPFTFTTLCASQLSGAVTINPGLPASSTNFQSFTALSSELNACGISGPVTVTVAPNSGPYTERFILNQIVGASAINTITINGNNNLLTFNATVSADRATVLFNGADYITINNLKIEGQSTAQAHAVHLYNEANYNTFTGCEFIVSESTTTTFVSGVIFSSSLTSATTAGNTGNYNTFSNNLFKGGYYGITLMGTSTTVACQQNKVLNNTFTNYYLYGVYLSNQEDAEITANDLSRATRSTLGTFYGVAFFGTNPGTLINRNKIHDNASAAPSNTSAAYPIYASSGAGTIAKPMNIVNNAVYNINGFGTKYGLYLLTNCFFLNIYHNTVDLSNPSQTGTSLIAGIYHTGLATGVDLKNNIIVVNNGSTGLKRVLWFSNTAPAFTSNYNNLINLSTPGANTVIATRGTTNFTTLIDWQQAAANIYDQNSVDINPVFANVATGNISPLNGGLNNLGTPIASVLFDLDNIARSATTPDLGALEFTGIPSDLAVVSGQLKREQCYSVNDSVKITITNVIGGTVDFSTAPVIATWNVTGPTNSNGTITVNTGTLAPGASLVLKGAGVAMPSGGTYTLNASINSSSFNLSPTNDVLVPVSLIVNKLVQAVPQLTTITNSTDTVELKAFSPFFPNGGFFITEVCQFRGSATGAPVGGWPAYMLADDYIEITGAPFSDLGGFTLEQWSTTVLQSSYTFPSGTVLNANGNAIIAVGELGSSQPSPANSYFHGTGTFTGTFGSGTGCGRILKDGLNNIMDAVGYSGSTTTAYVFPAAANVSATDWGTSPLGGSGTAGIRLEGADLNTSTGWLVSSALTPQNPNAINNLVTAPSAPPVAGFNWNLNGTSVSTNTTYWAGPFTFTSNGTYKYVAAYNSTACGMVYDTATVIVNLPCPVYATPFLEGFESNSTTLSCWSQSLVTGTKNWTVATGAGGGSVTTAKSGTANMRFTSSSGGPHITRLISPQMNASTLTASELRFSYAQEVWFGDQNYLNVYYRDSLTGPWYMVWSDSTNKASWTDVIQAIPSTSATLQFAFEGVDNYGRSVVLDNVQLDNVPSCPAPTMLGVNSTTSASANVYWTTGGAANWVIEYGPTGFVLGAGTTMAATNDTTTIAGLMPNTAYSFYVRDNCGAGDSSAWAGPVSFTTQCATVALNYIETFETASTTLACWSFDANWATSTLAGGFGTSTTSLRMPFYNISNSTPWDATSPVFTATGAGYELVFDHAGATYTAGEVDTVEIYYSMDAGATYSLLVSLNNGPTGVLATVPPQSSSFTPTAAQWATYQINLPVGANRLIFRAISDFGNNLYLDNVTVRAIPLLQVDLPITFDDPLVNYNPISFGGAIDSILVDPTDPTNKVIRQNKPAGAQTWAGTTLGGSGLANPVPFAVGATIMKARVWSPDSGTAVLLKTENTSNGALSVETMAYTSVAGSWDTLTFNFLNHATGTPALNYATVYDKVSVFCEFGNAGSGKTYFVDDVMFVASCGNWDAMVNVMDGAAAIPNAQVVLNGDTTSTDAAGNAMFADLPNGMYPIMITKDCYVTEYDTVTIDCANESAMISLTLELIQTSSSATICKGDFIVLGTQVIYTAGVYSEVLASALGCDSTVTLTVAVDSVDNTVTANGVVLTANLAGGTYQWVDCGTQTAITGATSQSYTVMSNGSFAVVVSDGNCTDTSACINITDFGIDKYGLGDFGLYPNPNDGYFVLTGLTDFGNDATIEIVNLAGAVVYTTSVVATAAEEVKIDLRGLPAGMYHVRVSSEHGAGTKPFVIR
jgi:hypothetical protein